MKTTVKVLDTLVEFLDARKEFLHLKDARSLLTKKQESLWNYFVPRKNMDLFYSTNGEGYEKPLDRIFIDINMIKGIILVLSGIVSYFVFLYIFKGIQTEDKIFFKNLLEEKFKISF